MKVLEPPHLIMVLGLLLWPCCLMAQLKMGFYDKCCPDLENIVSEAMKEAVQASPRDAASILRLLFHDCFVMGCDASVLLEDVAGGLQGEKGALPNINSLRGFDIIDAIKARVEAQCPAFVSCADILALAARDAVVLANGPHWDVSLGRRDSIIASMSEANKDIPSPDMDLTTLVAMFQAKGLSFEDLVALSGAHTIGLARCTSFKQRLYNQSGTFKPDPKLSGGALDEMKSMCPPFGGDNNIHPLDKKSPNIFDNNYYMNLLSKEGVLNSDQVLYSTIGSSTTGLVQAFAYNQEEFFEKFSMAMIKLSNIKPLTGSHGEIRRNCRFRNH